MNFGAKLTIHPPLQTTKTITATATFTDRLCGLVVRVLGYRSGGPGSIPGTTRKKNSWSGTGSTQPREYNWEATWKKSRGSCLENREYGRRDPSRCPCGTLYPQKLAITSPTSGGRTVGIVRSRTQATELVFLALFISYFLLSAKFRICTFFLK
jgi:hypothetical protein